MLGEVAFFCDSSLSAGLGHVNRCLAIAEALEPLEYGSVFVGEFCPSSEGAIRAAGFPCEKVFFEDGSLPLNQILEVLKKRPFAAIVIDSYAVTASSMSKIRAEVAGRLMVIDDTGELDRYECDGVINFSFLAESRGISYRGTNPFLGPEYFPARKWLMEVRRARKAKSVAVKPSRGMIFAGGGDDGTLTCRLMRIFAELNLSMEVDIFLRSDAVKFGEAEKFLLESGLNGRIINGDSLFRVALSESDLNFCAGGLVKYESAFAGLPSVVFSATEIQREDTKYFENRGMCLSLDGIGQDETVASLRECSQRLADPDFRSSMIEKGLTYFPADSSKRAAMAVLGHN